MNHYEYMNNMNHEGSAVGSQSCSSSLQMEFARYPMFPYCVGFLPQSKDMHLG